MAASHVVVGGGVNGLSVAWALAERGADVVVLDKGRIGGGASGLAGGIVRNYYRSEPIAELVRLSVEIFEEEPEAYGFRQVGYIAAVPRAQVDDLVATPVCDWAPDNTYAIVDSGHSCKTLAIGRLAADDITDGGEPLLEPFRLDRFERGALHTASTGPYPWT
jgi:choline dehydrogenase-like flavoprotein